MSETGIPVTICDGSTGESLDIANANIVAGTATTCVAARDEEDPDAPDLAASFIARAASFTDETAPLLYEYDGIRRPTPPRQPKRAVYVYQLGKDAHVGYIVPVHANLWHWSCCAHDRPGQGYCFTADEAVRQLRIRAGDLDEDPDDADGALDAAAHGL